MEKNLKLIYFGSEKSHGQQKQTPQPQKIMVDRFRGKCIIVQSHPQLVCTLDEEKENSHGSEPLY
jgi:hypothetical protein